MRFTDVSREAGVDFRHVNGSSPDKHLVETIGSGGLFFDYDNDGWIDIFLVDGGSLADPAVAKQARHRLYRNRGNGTFDDVTARSGHPPSRVRDGRLRGRLRQRRLGRSLRHQLRPEHPVPQRRQRSLHGCHPRRARRLPVVEHELRLRGSRSGRRPRPVRDQLRGRRREAQPLLRQRQAADALLLSPAQLRTAAEHRLPQRRQRRLLGRQRTVRRRRVSGQRPRRRHRRLRR